MLGRFHAWYKLCKQGWRFSHQKGIYSPPTRLQPSLLGSHFLERRSKALSDSWTPPTNRSTLPFVWHSAPLLRLRHKIQPFPARSLPPHWALAHTACMSCVSFFSTPLFLLLSAMSWFPFFTLSSPHVPPYLPLTVRQEASSLTGSLYFPEEITWTVRTQTGRVNKITIRKYYIIRALECDFNLGRRGWERIKERGSGWGSPGVTIMQNEHV